MISIKKNDLLVQPFAYTWQESVSRTENELFINTYSRSAARKSCLHL